MRGGAGVRFGEKERSEDKTEKDSTLLLSQGLPLLSMNRWVCGMAESGTVKRDQATMKKIFFFLDAYSTWVLENLVRLRMYIMAFLK